MGQHVTIARITERHRREVGRLLLDALERNDWSLTRTAADLEVTIPRLQRMIALHGLAELYAAGNPGRGRPRNRPAAES